MPSGERCDLGRSNQSGQNVDNNTVPASVRFGDQEAGRPDKSMLIPTVGQRVRVSGEVEEYMVIRVDAARHLADLMRMSGIRRVEEGSRSGRFDPCAKRSQTGLPC